MKSALTALLGISLALSLQAAEESPFKNSKDKASYAIGANWGKQLRQMSADIDVEALTKALKDSFKGDKALLTDDQIRETLTAFQQDSRTRMSDKNRKSGQEFLAANQSKEGVITTASGLQYKVATKGAGKIPTTNDAVVCHYRGTLIDGTEFDSSYKRGEPSSFGVTGVIKGWTEALLMMPVGSKWQLFIPSELAYGERGRQGIPPNSTLLFDIELVSIKDPTEAGAVSKPIQIQPQSIPTPKAK